MLQVSERRSIRESEELIPTGLTVEAFYSNFWEKNKNEKVKFVSFIRIT